MESEANEQPPILRRTVACFLTNGRHYEGICLAESPSYVVIEDRVTRRVTFLTRAYVERIEVRA